jgi:hypothetical protein
MKKRPGARQNLKAELAGAKIACLWWPDRIL